ncbi:hypothetical protein ATANTOWER_030515 [Ataeniobius toweri]|uniref:Uncharacterized protein n=1 Tax=Ataeniobius toweri TaxID=208326 RepID=A0ABU7BPD1_9TELE|nr:hypothetical protein [Ataeniobius toweri]
MQRCLIYEKTMAAETKSSLSNNNCKDHSRRKLLVAVDLFCLLLAGLPFLVIETCAVQPYSRGFYCDDESIRYPAKNGDTISDGVLSAAGILITILSVSHLTLITNVIFTLYALASCTCTSGICGSHMNSHANPLFSLLYSSYAISCFLYYNDLNKCRPSYLLQLFMFASSHI